MGTGRTPSRLVKHATKRRAFRKPRATKPQQNPAGDLYTAACLPARPLLPRTTQHPLSIIAGPLPARRSKVEFNVSETLSMLYLVANDRSPSPNRQTARSKRGTSRATRQIESVQRLNAAVSPSQLLKSKAGTRQHALRTFRRLASTLRLI